MGNSKTDLPNEQKKKCHAAIQPEASAVGVNGVRRPSDHILKRCPFCGKELGKIALIKRKTKKDCKCNGCGKIIRNKFIVYFI